MKRATAILLALSACGGSDSITSGGPPTTPIPSGTNIGGRVVNRFGEAVAGARVRIGTAAAVTTDGQGRFSAPQGPAVYDAAVEVDAASAGGVGRAVVYQGLKRLDPLLTIPGLTEPGSGSAIHSTSFSITLTDGPPGSVSLLWAFTSASGFVAAGRITGAPVSFTWNGPANGVNIGTLAGLAGPASGGITASGNVPFTAGAGVTSATVSVGVTMPYAIAGTSRPPAGCAVGTHTVVVPASDGTTTTVAGDSATHPPGAAATFAIDAGFSNEVPLSLRVPATCPPGQGTTFLARRLSLSKTSFDFDVPAPPQTTAPAAGATATLTTPFTWTAPAAAVSVVHFDRLDTTGVPLATLDVLTAGNSITFPDLTALNAAVVPGTTLSWHVETWGGVTSTDALAAAGGFGPLLAGSADFSHGVSESSAVTIAR